MKRPDTLAWTSGGTYDHQDTRTIPAVHLAAILDLALLIEGPCPTERDAIKAVGRSLYGEDWKPPKPGQGRML